MDAQNSDKQIKHKKKRIWIGCSIVVALIACVLCFALHRMTDSDMETAEWIPSTVAIPEETEMPEELAEPEKQYTYNRALTLLYERSFTKAKDIFSELGDFRDSVQRAEFCEIYAESEPTDQPTLISAAYLEKIYEKGKLYNVSLYGAVNNVVGYTGFLYVPNEVSADTKFALYYCGGISGDILSYSGMYFFLSGYSPNAIILFTNTSGVQEMTTRNRTQYSILQQAAYEKGTTVHDISVLGSDYGCYTAMWAAYQFPTEFKINVRTCICLDPGNHWNVPYWISDDQYEAIKESGTILYLFEQPGVGTDVVSIQRMAEHAMTVYIVECQESSSEAITENAFERGIFSWAIGDNSVTLSGDQYNFVRLEEIEPE